MNWIEVIYNEPQATVVTKGLKYIYIYTHRGTQQGCPLSPLLFALAIEPLAEAIRTIWSVCGLQIKDVCHKITLYADDVLVFLSSPDTSIPALINTINLFSKFSGYKVN